MEREREGSSLCAYTAGLYGAGEGPGATLGVDWLCFSSGAELQGLAPGVLGVLGVLGAMGVPDWLCLSSVAELQGLAPGVLGEMGVVGST